MNQGSNKNDTKEESSSLSFFTVPLSFQGQTRSLDGLTLSTTAQELFQRTRQLLFPKAKNDSSNDNDNDDDAAVVLKILYQGKQIVESQDQDQQPVFTEIPKKKTAKLIVLASRQKTLQELNSKRSDPLLRGFDQERKTPTVTTNTSNNPWHGISQQDAHYKFVRLQACTAQAFGHRATDTAPHAFQAQALLETLASDPGIVAIMKSRQLVVNTLGEMDPIDDRIMQMKQSQHGNSSCLLGYNTNHGLRIDLRLRTLDLLSFLPYSQLVSTLIHELSHNWVSEHDVLFWTNFGQMRVEYLYTHYVLSKRGMVVKGQTTAQLAGLNTSRQLNTVTETVLQELQGEMAQHGLPAQLVAPALQQCLVDLQHEESQRQQQAVIGGGGGQRLGTATTTTTSSVTTTGDRGSSARELALAAAEHRRQRNGGGGDGSPPESDSRPTDKGNSSGSNNNNNKERK